MGSAVFERYPNLRVVFGESGIGWIPYVIDRMDFEYEDQYKDLPLKLKPSEYWRRQCKATFQYDRVGTKLIDEMGVETSCGAATTRIRTACGRSRRSTSPSSSSTCRTTSRGR
jgi:hypothetical protein